MNEQTLPFIELPFGLRDVLAYQATAYVSATLDKLVPALSMPDQDVLNSLRHARLEQNEYQQCVRELVDDQNRLKRQVIHFSFTTLFHIMERKVQQIVLRFGMKTHEIALTLERDLHFDHMIRELARLGYNAEAMPYWRNIHKLKLIANAVKHGHGKSLTKLEGEFPCLFLHRQPDEQLTPEHLFLEGALLKDLAESVAAFWKAFPAQPLPSAVTTTNSAPPS